MIRIAITDDHLLILKGIQELLHQLDDVQVVGTYMNIQETRIGIPKSNPEILFLDLNLPDGDGVQLCKELRKDYPNLKIIALTSYNQVVLVKSMMRNGASGYLLKNTSLDELRDTIHCVYEGGQYLQKEIKEVLLQNSLGVHSTHGSFQPMLTQRETEVLDLIVKEHTTQEIADKLFISVKTVEAHRTHLMDKLGVRNLAGLVKVAIEKGLC
ncbi:MAG TPA: response regulator transcription factor [Cyclobacteriaceae bacterium]|mgnify:CR=1 FL=1|nr:response regulator transcription factor [Cyclobacteriaceae bacterium]HMU05531.1 response regulator transcription factor [Saprospiraceae bacterium]HRE68746.1 response regulator transcription factor [Cyclobacteriaceae bacterium]HRF35323.1 response regulator transcription factor [Cyclobacteriaceae bacterium]